MENIYKTTFWDYLIYIGAAMIIGWALLKILGVMQSPVWFEVLPYLGVGVAIIGIGYRLVGTGYKFGQIMEGMRNTDRKVDRLLEIGERFKRVEHEHNLFMDDKLKMEHPKRFI